jgi:LmbE family N-acetylglucosaminyl deacetylase
MPPEFFVDTTSVHEKKNLALTAHKSQTSWLQESQDCDALTEYLSKESLQLGKQSGSFRHAEGWWRHAHLGFSTEGFSPLEDALKSKVKKNSKFASSF